MINPNQHQYPGKLIVTIHPMSFLVQGFYCTSILILLLGAPTLIRPNPVLYCLALLATFAIADRSNSFPERLFSQADRVMDCFCIRQSMTG